MQDGVDYGIPADGSQAAFYAQGECPELTDELVRAWCTYHNDTFHLSCSEELVVDSVSAARQFLGKNPTPAQMDALHHMCIQKHVFIVMPTGWGKSLLYQAVGLARPGVTVVVSPLLALAHDQVHGLRALGIQASSYDSCCTPDMKADLRKELLDPGSLLRFLFASPETLTSGNRRLLQCLIDVKKGSGRLQRIVVDEAHLVPTWGSDFRCGICHAYDGCTEPLHVIRFPATDHMQNPSC
jgi:ATP-dependent helicase YprA (DUF1998 family)